MKLSARNQLKGKIVDVQKGATTSHVRIDIGGGAIVTASITNEAVAELGLKTGDVAVAVIKASDVMVGIYRTASCLALVIACYHWIFAGRLTCPGDCLMIIHSVANDS